MIQTKKILIVEDEDNIRDDVSKILSLSGFETFEAKNGSEGFQLAVALMPDLIISDVMMPEIDGIEMLNMLMSNPATENIPLIFLSAKSDILSLREGMNLGAVDYISKPFDFNELINAVNLRLSKKEKEMIKWRDDIESLRGNIINTLPHELRTPLSIILGYTEFVKERIEDLSKDEILEMLTNIHGAGKRLQRLIENYLQLAQIEILVNSPSEIHALKSFKTYSTANLIHTIINEKSCLQNRLADIKINLEDVSINAFESHFTKIIEEIFDNALKYTTKGEQIKVESFIHKKRFHIKITDTGRGMTDEQISKIGAYMQFERNLYEQQGVGLGLIISKKLTEVNQGLFKITSNEPKGLIVEMSFKIAQ